VSLLTQKTINKKFSISGVGVHTGLNVNMNVIPAPANSGIIFKRIDLRENNTVIPNYNNVVDATLCTTIANEYGVKVSTIEHLMGAFYGLGVDNAIVELDSQEVPIIDGSAKKFVELLLDVGFKNYEEPIKLIKIEKKIELSEGSKSISINKSNVTSEIDFEIKYQNQIIKTQRNKINVFEDDLSDIYNSRTFCLYEDLKKLEKLGLGKGGSLDNAIVVKDNLILNQEGLRNKQEFVNHKILDCMGDLYLSGYRIVGSLNCSQGGHSLTNKLLTKIFDDKKNYSLIEIKGKNLPHLFANRNSLKSIA
tara:strand:+ start:4037 stop:4957 length:921 start_codon:yes stop_codon:yes gene_type:complete